MNLGKVNGSLGSAYLENTFALAQVNFDFALYKIEAPPEYQPLGAALTTRRRTDAEGGTQHITARKLGALFKHIIPSIPHLVKAYGRRSSEISTNEKANPKGTKNDGGFAPFVGIDATSIWAAATSSPEAVAIHLLACMLARMFPAAEATSVWVELVRERRGQIEAKCNQDVEFDIELVAAAQAARQDISRAQLSNWDASARAWLLTADETKLREYKKLMLLVKNSSLPVNSRTDVYQSVTSAWTSAMVAVENLIRGMPQTVQDGAILLGLSAWHIYPDVVIIMNRIQESKFGDPLVGAGGLLTIGLQTADEGDGKGVYWSLSLAHLRFYGDPVLSTGETGAGFGRVTFEQLGVATLGSIAAGWAYEDETGILEVAEWLIQLWRYLSRFCRFVDGLEQAYEKAKATEHEARQMHSERSIESCQAKHPSSGEPFDCPDCRWLDELQAETEIRGSRWEQRKSTRSFVHSFLACRPGWLQFLEKSSRALIDSQGQEREDLKKLAKFGLRRGRIFLGEKRCHSAPAFGLLRLHKFMSMLSESGRIEQLRRIALNCGLDKLPRGNAIIRYRHTNSFGLLARYEFATAVPHAPYRNPNDPLEASDPRHCRFIGFARCSCTEECHRKTCPCVRSGAKCTRQCHSTITEKRRCPTYDGRLSENFWQDDDMERCNAIKGLGEDCISLADTTITTENSPNSDIDEVLLGLETFTWGYAPKEISVEEGSSLRKDVIFAYVCGDTRTAAIFIRIDQAGTQVARNAKRSRLNMENLNELMRSDAFPISVTTLIQFLTTLGPTWEPSSTMTAARRLEPRYTYYPALTALAAADEVYSILPSSTVSLDVMLRPLYDALWTAASLPSPLSSDSFKRYSGPKLTRAATFACIAMFDSGHCNLQPAVLSQVMAMSMGNSIYIATPLLDDPFIVHPRHAVKRVIGNIGRPGIAMMIPPQHPRVKALETDAWKVVNHFGFNGSTEDCFSGTSMHLSFTGYEIPVSLNSHGQQDIDVFLLESVISIHDCGEWIADLDILRLLEKEGHVDRHECQCEHSENGVTSMRLASIDCWPELLDAPVRNGVVRARGNWTGRLATAVTALQRGHDICIIHGIACWTCLHERGLLEDERRKKGRLQPDHVSRIFIY